MTDGDHPERDGVILDPGPGDNLARPETQRSLARLVLCVLATGLFALALVADVTLAFIRPTCPSGWTSWDFEPGLALIIGVPVSLLLVVSIVATRRARSASRSPRGGAAAATLVSALLALLATGTVVLIAAGLVEQAVNPNWGCTTF